VGGGGALKTEEDFEDRPKRKELSEKKGGKGGDIPLNGKLTSRLGKPQESAKQ